MHRAEGGVGFFSLLQLLLIGLKLGGVLAWSWWWVLSPLWISWGAAVIGFAVLLGCVVVMEKRQK